MATKPQSSNASKPGRYNVFYARPFVDGDGTERSDFMRCGVAFELKNRDGYALQLYMLPPAQKDGSLKVVLLNADEEK